MQDTVNGINYVTGATYTPWGALTGANYGSAGITVANSYNKRLQPLMLAANAPSQTLLSLTYNFGLGTNDNGNVQAITNNRDLSRSQNFAYDSLNRIAFAWSTGALWGERFEIDPWANLNKILQCQSGDPCYGKPQGEYLNQLADGNNRFTGMSYDAAGNLLNDGGGARTYNAENQLLTAAGVTFAYDGDGKRVKKSSGKLYWTGAGSEPLAESDLGGTINEEYVYFNGKRVARADIAANNTISAVHYYFSDHLGSASVVTNADGTSIQDESDYYPFGGERAISTSDPNAYKFTGKERDPETGLDNFGARYFSSSLGRFTTPDWSGTVVPVPYALFTDPQTLNLYSYVRDNPGERADLDGHCPWCVVALVAVAAVVVYEGYTHAAAWVQNEQRKSGERADRIWNDAVKGTGNVDKTIAEERKAQRDQLVTGAKAAVELVGAANLAQDVANVAVVGVVEHAAAKTAVDAAVDTAGAVADGAADAMDQAKEATDNKGKNRQAGETVETKSDSQGKATVYILVPSK